MAETLLDAVAIHRGLRRAAGEIAERGGVNNLALIGIRRGGEPLAKELASYINEHESTAVLTGSIDITLYRDDAATALPSPRIGPSHVPFSVAGKRIVIVDDVIQTGRTIRAAVDAILDYGRPSRIELFALIDRGGRELPIQPDYVVRSVTADAKSRIEVIEREDGLWAMLRATPAETAP